MEMEWLLAGDFWLGDVCRFVRRYVHAGNMAADVVAVVVGIRAVAGDSIIMRDVPRWLAAAGIRVEVPARLPQCDSYILQRLHCRSCRSLHTYT